MFHIKIDVMTKELKESIRFNVIMFLLVHAFLAVFIGVIYYGSGAYLIQKQINELKECVIVLFIMEFSVYGFSWALNKL